MSQSFCSSPITRHSLLLLLCLLTALPTWAQQGELSGELATEKATLAHDCSSSSSGAARGSASSNASAGTGSSQPHISILSCAADFLTADPLHITVGSIAPRDGVGFGPAFVYDHNPTDNWRMHLNADAVVSTNLSWRAGVYLNAIHLSSGKIKVTHQMRHQTKPKTLEVPPSPGVNFYAQMISLNKLLYFGEGDFTSKSQEAMYGMIEGIVGVNALLPLASTGLGVFGAINGRFVDIRGRYGDTSPSIGLAYSEATAPGLASQPAFAQFGEGLRFDRSFFAAHLDLNYSGTLQEFVAPGSIYSFRRLSVDLSHTFVLYGKTMASQGAAEGGPNERSGGFPRWNTVRNREGTIELDAFLTESVNPGGNVVPFYFQPTLGGSDINGSMFLPSYSDYRWRAPNAVLYRLSTEHSIWGPIGVIALADTGKVAETRGGLGLRHFRQSYGVGVTLRAGDIPQFTFMFAWGGNEGNHTIAVLNPNVYGGMSRPSLF